MMRADSGRVTTFLGVVVFSMVLMTPLSVYSSEPGPVLVSKTLSGTPSSGRTLSLAVRETTSRFRDGDLLHVFLDGSILEAKSPERGLFSVVISHLSGESHRVSLRFSRKDQTEWGSEFLLALPPVSPSPSEVKP